MILLISLSDAGDNQSKNLVKLRYRPRLISSYLFL